MDPRIEAHDVRMAVGEYLNGQPSPKLKTCPVCGAFLEWRGRSGDVDTYCCPWDGHTCEEEW
jgi:hypothetical protein